MTNAKPNFTRILKTLEERLGTSDIVIRYAHSDHRSIHLWTNIPTKAFTPVEQGYFRMIPYSRLKVDEKMAIRHMVVMRARLVSGHRNWLPIDEGRLGPFFNGESQAYAWSFSRSFITDFPEAYAPFEVSPSCDEVTYHESVHAAVYNAIGEQPKLYARSWILDEALAASETIEFCKKFHPNLVGNILQYMEEIRNSRFHLHYATAYDLVLSNDPDVKVFRQKINDLNKVKQ